MKIKLPILNWTKELKEQWVEYGIYYGYPKCCIINFCTRSLKLTKEQDAVHKNTGFTPCPECSKKILKGEATLESLLTDRICKKKFPKDDNFFYIKPKRKCKK